MNDKSILVIVGGMGSRASVRFNKQISADLPSWFT